MMLTFIKNCFNSYDGYLDSLQEKYVQNSNAITFKTYAVEHAFDGNAFVVFVPKNFNLFAYNSDLKSLHAQDHTKIIYEEVSSIDDIDSSIEKIKSQNLKIKGVMLFAHGSPGMLELEENNYLTNYPFRHKGKRHIRNTELLRDAFSQIEEDGVIILKSCRTGHVNNEGKPSLAQTIASLAPGKLVIAPTQDIPGAGGGVFKWTNEKPDMTFTVEKKSEENSLLAKMRKIFNTIGFVLFRYGDDVTARLKAVPTQRK